MDGVVRVESGCTRREGYIHGVTEFFYRCSGVYGRSKGNSFEIGNVLKVSLFYRIIVGILAGKVGTPCMWFSMMVLPPVGHVL